jgi:hypothetical protein
MSARDQARRDAEFDRLLAELMNEKYVDYTAYDMRQAYELGKRHEAEKDPAWHDAPTCPGLWVIDGDAYDVYDFDGTLSVADGGTSDEPWEGRWYGPIPADEAKP